MDEKKADVQESGLAKVSDLSSGGGGGTAGIGKHLSLSLLQGWKPTNCEEMEQFLGIVIWMTQCEFAHINSH